jgi:hypothetical protein
MGEALRRRKAGQYPRAKRQEIDLERAERIGREMNMPDDFMAQLRALLAPGGINYEALRRAGGDTALAFEAEAIAESVSTDGVLDPEKWEALIRSMGLRGYGIPRRRRMRR